ncbi:hypothetical protein HNR60_004792 [Rhodopseudomonas rhenobacensis]|uniref:Uncharacterized protein n=1 Tax=Rhodopseudomonas rhenobacensis TaxID=87461 RepID=A0A7W7Z9K1_9BRAD|nr:hypothetical protein [Rhodopseudomonas rhenobacensis]MBB5050007.1 hypothetical protein [Rhodopseudomonas rhenobacensis]
MKLRYAFAALTIAALAVPSIASAETTVIKKVYRDGPRAEMRHHHDRGMHRGVRMHRGGDKVVIIKKRHHRY